jgi:Glycosyl transferases group 1
MLICDNKKYLGEIYELGKEAVGFDSIEECIDLCHYYLAHDDERRAIAGAGWKRAVEDYKEVAVFQRTVKLIEKYYAVGNPRTQGGGAINEHLATIRFSKYNTRLAYATSDLVKEIKRAGSRVKNKILKS